MNKRADYRWADSLMFIFCFVLIGIFILGGTLKFYAYAVDLRGEESRVLFDSLLKGVVDGGEINEDVFREGEGRFNIFKASRIDKKIIEGQNFYFKVEIFKGEVREKIFEEGTRAYDVECGLNGKNFPVCYRDDVIVKNKQGEEFKVRILAASNQIGEKV